MNLEGWDLAWLDDPSRREETERACLQGAQFMATFPARFDAGRSEDELRARALFVQKVTKHWPPGPDRPREIALLVERFGEPE